MKYVIWDFDGTLGYRVGMWSGALLQVLRREVPGCSATIDDIRPHLRSGFPWHSPEHVCSPNQPADAWWDKLLPILEQAFQQGAGLTISDAQRLARQVRAAYVNPEHWRLFEDTLPCLDQLRAEGCSHIVLSNHVPELRVIMQTLGLGPYIACVYNSAETGVEKPNPQAFMNVLDSLPDAQRVWMVGDNLVADIAGAQAVGLPAVLVRQQNPQAQYSIDSLDQLPGLLASVDKPSRP